MFFSTPLTFWFKVSALFIFYILSTPTSAYAYLDPGSGNALIYFAVSLIGTVIYFAKNIFYSILGRYNKDNKADSTIKAEENKIVIFSEGKAYWYTFSPIVEAFIKEKKSFSYITMDIEDPALAIDNPYMHSKFIGNGTSAFAKAANNRSIIMLSTTPNIGTDGFPMPRPKHVKCLAHVFHAIGDIATYHKHSLDNYDAALLVGNYQEENIRRLEQIRNLPTKECYIVGLPYFDVLAEKLKKIATANNTTTILIAPSWGDRNLLGSCGTQFIHDIAKAQYDVILRPHPQSWKVENDFLAKLKEEFSIYSNIIFDNDVDSTNSLQKADLMISDKSSVRFDFAFLYERPVITIDAPLINVEQFEYSDLDFIWEDAIAKDIGIVIDPKKNEHHEIIPIIQKTLNMPTSTFSEMRTKYITNFKTSGHMIAKWAINKEQELINDK